MDPIWMFMHAPQALPVTDPPEPDHPIIIATDQQRAVWAERD
jgi:hypothetical protein